MTCSKALHTTYRRARTALRKLTSERKGRLLINEAMEIYWCNDCHGHHLGGTTRAKHVRDHKRATRTTRHRIAGAADEHTDPT